MVLSFKGLDFFCPRIVELIIEIANSFEKIELWLVPTPSGQSLLFSKMTYSNDFLPSHRDSVKKNLAIPRTDVEISQISSCQKTNGKHHQTTNLRAENTSDSLTDVWWLGPFCPWCPAGPGKMVSTIRKKKTDQSSKAAWGVSWMVKICKVMWWSSSIPGNSVGGLFWMVRSSFQKISALGDKKDHFESNEPRVCSWQKNVSWINRYCWLLKASWPRIIADSQLSVGDTPNPGSWLVTTRIMIFSALGIPTYKPSFATRHPDARGGRSKLWVSQTTYDCAIRYPHFGANSLYKKASKKKKENSLELVLLNNTRLFPWKSIKDR